MEALQELRTKKNPELIFYSKKSDEYSVDRKEHSDRFRENPEEFEHLNIPVEDGKPLESNWHRIQMNLLIDSVHARWQDRNDYFAGGNMFIHYSVRQIKNRDFLGPDFFVVKDTDGKRKRDTWNVWEENCRFPDVIVELASPSTIQKDLGKKKRIYESIFRTPEYFCYNPETQRLKGWKLRHGKYEMIVPNDPGWLKSEELGLWLGKWEGEIFKLNAVWLRLYDDNGEPVPTQMETEAHHARTEAQRADMEAQRAQSEAQRADMEAQRAIAEARRAEMEAQRAQSAEAELMRLRAFLAKQGIEVPEKDCRTDKSMKNIDTA